MSVILSETHQHRPEKLRALLSRSDMASNAQDRCGNTALHLAMNEAYMDAGLCKLLLHRGDLDVNIQNKEGNSPLHLLALQRDDDLQGNETFVPHSAMCMLLGRRDLTVNLDNNEGDAPLHLAARGGNTMFTRLLLFQGGADANIQNKQAHTSLQAACLAILDIVCHAAGCLRIIQTCCFQLVTAAQLTILVFLLCVSRPMHFSIGGSNSDWNK